MNLFAFLRRDKKSGNVARERLMAVVAQDRYDNSEAFLGSVRMDVVAALQKYMDVDEEQFRLELKRDRDGELVMSTLQASVPVLKLHLAGANAPAAKSV